MTGRFQHENLTPALLALCQRDWAASRDLLQSMLALESSPQRTLLFLLSIAATSSGHRAIGEQLWDQARDAALTLSDPRQLKLPDDADDSARELCRELETAWRTFNGWLCESDHVLSYSLEEQDWSRFIRLLVQAEARQLEKEYGWLLSGEGENCLWLWNLLALAHLEAGDVYTYEEMTATKPTATGQLPERLTKALAQEGLQTLIPQLTSGSWCTSLSRPTEPTLGEPQPLELSSTSTGNSDPAEFWSRFSESLSSFQRRDFEGFRRASACLESLLPREDSAEKAVLLYLSAGSCLLEGDQFGAQDFSSDLAAMTRVVFPAELAQTVAEHLIAADLQTVADRLLQRAGAPVPEALTPWQDFQPAII